MRYPFDKSGGSREWTKLPSIVPDCQHGAISEEKPA
jgi:hypothetical protein